MLTNFKLYDHMLYCLQPQEHSSDKLKKILLKYPEIRFVSLSSIDIAGNDTDVKIPIDLFLKEIDSFLNGSVQTDGSSVVLPLIATINDAQVDFIADTSVNWYVDYNYENILEELGKPVGTLRIPCFLRHRQKFVCSRSLLRRALNKFDQNLQGYLRTAPELIESQFNRNLIESCELTIATELEFWVRTPDDVVAEEHLSTSQGLKEQYWKRTKGVVRTALERTLMLLARYGFEPEMGHKEVGGVKAHLNGSGDMDHIVEQLEIDWSYANALQAIDNEGIIRILIKEVFRLHGLEVSFRAKPIPGVAGSGKHTHFNVLLRTKDGKKYNLFAPVDPNQEFLSNLGWGALMGVMKHYNSAIAPFVTCCNDAFERLTPHFEAPTHAVATIGRDVRELSRNRTVLISLIRPSGNQLATRFELRSPHPKSNLYFVVSALCQAMDDGIKNLIDRQLTDPSHNEDLYREFTKEAGQDATYLKKQYAYRSEEDIFSKYTAAERDELFGKPAQNVHEALNNLLTDEDSLNMLCAGEVFDERLIRSYTKAMLDVWELELRDRLIAHNRQWLRELRALHKRMDLAQQDLSYLEDMWQIIQNMRCDLAVDRQHRASIFTQISDALNNNELHRAAQLQSKMSSMIKELRNLYKIYSENCLD